MSNDPYINTSASPARSPSQGAPPSNVLAIISLVLGILSIVPGICCICLNIPLGIGAAITGFMALNKVKDGSGGGKGLAMTGMILGIIGIVLTVLLFIANLLTGGAMQLVDPNAFQ